MTEGQSVKQPEAKKPFVVKVYLVYIPVNTAKDREPNRKLISAKLTWGAACHIRDQIPGTIIERIFVDKEIVNIDDGDIYTLLKSLKGE